MKAIIFLALLFFTPTASSYDVECGDKCLQEGERPTCSELGYQKSALTTCPEGYITCPYDEGDGSTYIWCKTYTCHDGDLFEPSEVSAKLEEGFVCYKTTFHERTCYTCTQEEADPCVWSEENKGEGYLEDSSVCDNGKHERCVSTCENADIPTGEGVIAKKRMCTACGESKLVISGYECHPYYTDTGSGCEYKVCPTPTTYTSIPYSTNVTSCSNKGFPDGWVFEVNGMQGGFPCGRCVPKECVAPYVPASQAPCNKTGLDDQGNGFTMIDDGHSGDEWCRWCQSWSCTSPYDSSYQSINDCPTSNKSGWSADKAWNFSTDPENEYCGRCTEKTCPSGYDENLQSIENCPNTSGYTFKTSSTTFNGQNYCGKCEVKTCTSGSTGLKIADCTQFPSTAGVTLQPTGAYSGEEPCKQCVCDTSSLSCTYAVTGENGKTPIGEGGVGGSVCCDGTYQTCTNTSCNGKAGSCPDNAICATTCTACGTTYYTATSCISDNYTLDTANNRCVLNTCSTYSLTDPESCPSDAYVCTPDTTHGECCKTCTAKTCTDYNSTYLKSTTGTETCSTGYKRTNHNNLKSGTSTIDCYDCEDCEIYANYLNSVPSNAETYDTKYSCSTPKYCALTCNTGYHVDVCSCVENDCANYGTVTSTSNLVYFDYRSCKKGSSTLYIIDNCSDGYSKEADCNTQNGDWFTRATEQNITCGKCYVCDEAHCGSTCGTTTEDCSGKTVTENNKPLHSHVTGTACTKITKDANSNKCIEGGTFYPSFECDTPDYTWNGTECVVSTCVSGIPYSSTQQEPYKSGYTCTKNSYTAGSEDCYDCTINTCAAGSATSARGCGNGTGKSNGWKLGAETGVIAGSSPCKYCEEKNCPDGYATSVEGCGDGGFALSDAHSGFSGDDVCKKCTCDQSHCDLDDDCHIGLKSCDNHPYTEQIDYADMTGDCYTVTKSGDQCVESEDPVWSGFKCGTGRTPSNGACVCDTSKHYFNTPEDCKNDTVYPAHATCKEVNDCHVFDKYVCDSTQGYYDQKPTGAQATNDGACWVPSGCDTAGGYTATTSEYPYYFFSYSSTPYTFNKRVGNTVSQQTCYKVDGCSSPRVTREYWNSHYNGCIYEDDDATLGGTNCVKGTTQCAYGKVSENECSTANFTSCGSWSSASGEITCGTCAENCDQYTDNISTKWIVSQSDTWDDPANINKCKSDFNLYPTDTTATCGGTKYRKCTTPSCQRINSDYVDNWPGTRTSRSSFYRRVYDAGGYDVDCWDKEDSYDWYNVYSTSQATCTVYSNLNTRTVHAYWGEVSTNTYVCCDLVGSETTTHCNNHSRTYPLYKGVILAKGFNFITQNDSNSCPAAGGTETYKTATCWINRNGKTYYTYIDDTADHSSFDQIAVILSTDEDNNGFRIKARPKNVYECGGPKSWGVDDGSGLNNHDLKSYTMSDISDCNPTTVYYIDSNGYLKGCQDGVCRNMRGQSEYRFDHY